MNFRHHAPLLLGALAVAIALGFAEWRQANPPWAAYQASPEIRVITPAISEKPELCLTCHFGIEEISKSHPVDVFGCVSCHGGDPLSLDEAVAHQSLRGPGGNPADLSVVEQSCGTSACHGGDMSSNRNHIARVKLSLHATYAGAINSALQAQSLAGPLYGVSAAQAVLYGPTDTVDTLAGFEPSAFSHSAITAFADDCLACHLGAEPTAAPNFYRGTGCAACHTPYADGGLYSGGDPVIPKDEPGRPARHALTLIMPSTQCSQCHARGAYSIETMTFTPQDDDQPHADPVAVLCERELDCIDCHNAAETMGDGHLYPNLDASPVVECNTCHGTLDEPPSLMTLADPNDPAFRRDLLNDNYTLKEGDTVVRTPNGEALGAVRWQDGRLVLTSRITGKTFLVPPVQGSACQQNPDQQEARTCRECHATP